MKSKKIKLIIFHPYSKIGGADKSLSRLINRLDSSKYEIIFITIDKPYIKSYLKKEIKIIKIKSSKTIFSVIKIRKILKSFSEEKKVIFFSNQNFANIVSFFIIFRFSNIKHIVMERNHIDEFKYSRNFLDLIKKKIIFLLMKIFYKHADLVLGNAKRLCIDLKKMTNCKVKTIYNPAYDKEIFKLSKSKIKKINKKNIILNVGRLEIQKDQITLLKAIKNIDNIYLIIIGYGEKKIELKNYIRQHNLQKKVIILDNISNPYPYFKSAKLFVLSSLYEGFPNVLTEAIMFDVPVISSNCNSGPSEILLQNKGIHIYEKKNHIELEKKINLFFKNKNIFHKRNKLLKENLQRFNPEKIILEYDRIFQKI